MFCGSFSNVEDEDPWSLGSPKRSRRREKNPYSNRGLDKFSKLLVDLEARREKIISQIGDATLIRFMYSNSQDWVPIIVRQLRDPKQEKTQITHHRKVAENQGAGVEKPTAGVVGAKENSQPAASASDGKKIMKKSSSWNLDSCGSISWRWRCNYYWGMALMVILACLVLFGRSFAILCTSVWWYLLPRLKGGDGNGRRSMKKEYVRRLSEKKMMSGDARSHLLKMGRAEAVSPRRLPNSRK